MQSDRRYLLLFEAFTRAQVLKLSKETQSHIKTQIFFFQAPTLPSRSYQVSFIFRIHKTFSLNLFNFRHVDRPYPVHVDRPYPVDRYIPQPYPVIK